MLVIDRFHEYKLYITAIISLYINKVGLTQIPVYSFYFAIKLKFCRACLARLCQSLSVEVKITIPEAGGAHYWLHYMSLIVCDWAGGQWYIGTVVHWVKIFVDRKYFLNYEPGSRDQQQSPIVLVLALYNVLTI